MHHRTRPCGTAVLACAAASLLLFVAIAWMPIVAQVAPTAQPTYVLEGNIKGSDNHGYRLLPFSVPPGTERLSVEFSYTGAPEKTVIDIGLFDPERFRGWSGGDKPGFTISATDATPSYLPGPLPSGEWKLLLGIPNIRPTSSSTYTARIFLSRSIEPAPVVLSENAGWYQGDLHSHTAQSDGSCPSLSGKKVPCPEFKLAEAAAQAKLDFIAFTDHNTTSTYNALAQWQPYFDPLLFIRGREITTYGGHANIFGTSEFVDFRVDSDAKAKALLADVHQKGAILSINHPAAPSGEVCMGCGWTWHVDFAHVDAIEAVNGPDAETAFSGIPFWQARLNAGNRITAIGGSDDHNSATGRQRRAGTPTTVVYARQLSEPAILEGIRAGHVFIKTQGPEGPTVSFTADSAGQHAIIGDNVAAPSGQRVQFAVTVSGESNSKIEVIADGAAMPQSGAAAASHEFSIDSDGKRHWYRVNVRAADGHLLALTNPIYLNFAQ
jgi:hypothetical protein